MIDLTLRPPRSPRVRLGGLVLLPRILDKCRATLAGKNGEYNFNCPLDQRFFAFTRLDAEAFKAQAQQGKGDQAMLEWMFARGLYDAAMLEQLAQTFQSISSQWTGSVTSAYRLPNGDRIRVIFRGLSSAGDAGQSFREGRITLQFDHRF